MLNLYCGCQAFGQPISLYACFVIIPIAMVVALLPLSLNGVGLMEGVLLFGLPPLGASATAGVMSMLLIRAKTIVWVSGGYVVHLLLRAKRPDPNASAKPDVPGAANE